jgi:hypothetical protein
MSVTDRAPNPRDYVTALRSFDENSGDLSIERHRPVDLDMKDDARVRRAATIREVDLSRLEADIAPRLDRLKELARSLTYGEMAQWAKGQVAEKPAATWEEFAARFHAWSEGKSDDDRSH